MNLPKFAIRAAHSLVSAAAALFLLTAGAYAAYSLWDNAQVYAAVDNVQKELLSLKPDSGHDNGASFGRLRAVNSDVCAWLTLDGTGIDYPVLQGRDNMTYLNRDVYGNFALAGSIFLDAGICCTATTWRTARCSAIWICTRTRLFSTRTPPAH